MLKSLLLYVSIICCQTLFGQPEFENDKKFSPFLSKDYRRIRAEHGLSRNADFEYRIWAWRSSEWKFFLFIITQTSGKWSVRGFESSIDSLSTSKVYYKNYKEKNILDSNISTLIGKLDENKYLAIPDSKFLKVGSGKRIGTHVIHGTGYTFELIRKNSKRSYSYYCPENDAEEFPDVKEFSQVTNIIKTVFKYFGIGEPYICLNKSIGNKFSTEL